MQDKMRESKQILQQAFQQGDHKGRLAWQEDNEEALQCEILRPMAFTPYKGCSTDDFHKVYQDIWS